MVHRDAFHRFLVEYHVDDATGSIVGLHEFLVTNALGIGTYQCRIAFAMCELEVGSYAVGGSVTVGTGGVEEVLLDGVKHTDVNGSHFHLHVLGG